MNFLNFAIGEDVIIIIDSSEFFPDILLETMSAFHCLFIDK